MNRFEQFENELKDLKRQYVNIKEAIHAARECLKHEDSPAPLKVKAIAILYHFLDEEPNPKERVTDIGYEVAYSFNYKMNWIPSLTLVQKRWFDIMETALSDMDFILLHTQYVLHKDGHFS